MSRFLFRPNVQVPHPAVDVDFADQELFEGY
jgi:hypothetical protein